MLRLIFIILFSIILINYLLKKAATSRMNRHPSGLEPAFIKDHYLLGLIYYNSDDPRILVPKTTSPGYTLNFSKPILVLLIMLLVGWLIYQLYEM